MKVQSQRLKQYVYKKCLAASERARKRWSNTVSSQRSQGESSFGLVTLDEPVIAVPPGSASTPPSEGYLMPSGGNTTFQPGSAPAVPGKSGVPSPIGEIGSQDMASTGTAPKEVSLAPHVSSVQGGIVISVSKCLASHVQGGVTPVCTAESLCARFQRDLFSVIEDSAFTFVLSSGGSTCVPIPHYCKV